MSETTSIRDGGESPPPQEQDKIRFAIETSRSEMEKLVSMSYLLGALDIGRTCTEASLRFGDDLPAFSRWIRNNTPFNMSGAVLLMELFTEVSLTVAGKSNGVDTNGEGDEQTTDL